jgi:hypothetical protein
MSTDGPESTACHGYAASDAASPLRPCGFTRRALREDDVHCRFVIDMRTPGQRTTAG